MKLKKWLQACGFVLGVCAFNVAAAQQAVNIAEEYEADEIAMTFAQSGPTLLFSDSPELVYHNGILYRDTVSGDVRLFFHHVNSVKGNKKLAVMFKNADNMRPVNYKVVRSGIDGFAYDWMRDGKGSQKNYFDDEQQKKLASGKIGYGNVVEFLSGKGVILPTDKLLTGTIDLYFDKPTEVSVLMCDPKTNLEIYNEIAHIQPMDEHPLRGTFAASDWTYTLDRPVSAADNVMIKLAGPDVGDGYAKGVDATTGKDAENYGNYGVIYNVDFTVKGDKPVSFIINPIGGPFAGWGVLENKTSGKRNLVALPAARVSMGDTIEDALEIDKLTAGDYRFIWSPPGASNLPVRFIWRDAASVKYVQDKPSVPSTGLSLKERLAILRAEREAKQKK